MKLVRRAMFESSSTLDSLSQTPRRFSGYTLSRVKSPFVIFGEADINIREALVHLQYLLMYIKWACVQSKCSPKPMQCQISKTIILRSILLRMPLSSLGLAAKKTFVRLLSLCTLNPNRLLGDYSGNTIYHLCFYFSLPSGACFLSISILNHLPLFNLHCTLISKAQGGPQKVEIQYAK